MVIFNDLRITPDGQNLFIDIKVAPYKYFENMYISSISIDTEETFSPTGKPSSNAVVVYENQDTTVKEYSINLSPDKFKLSAFNNHIFYVYVSVAGTPSIDTPCAMDTEYTLGVVLNWQSIYQKGINHMKQVVNGCCELPRDFIDYMLRFKAFELAIRTAQYTLANDKFKEWFAEENVKFNPPCGCK